MMKLTALTLSIMLTAVWVTPARVSSTQPRSGKRPNVILKQFALAFAL